MRIWIFCRTFDGHACFKAIVVRKEEEGEATCSCYEDRERRPCRGRGRDPAWVVADLLTVVPRVCVI